MRLRLVLLRDSASCERFVVLRMLSDFVLLSGRALLNPPTLLMAGNEAITKASLMKTKIEEYRMHVKGML